MWDTTLDGENSCCQGYRHDWNAHPLADAVIEFGYAYSHSTRIRDLDGEPYLKHTFKLGSHNVGLDIRSSLWETSISTGSGHRWIGWGEKELRAHLRSKRRRYDELKKQKT